MENLTPKQPRPWRGIKIEMRTVAGYYCTNIHFPGGEMMHAGLYSDAVEAERAALDAIDAFYLGARAQAIGAEFPRPISDVVDINERQGE